MSAASRGQTALEYATLIAATAIAVGALIGYIDHSARATLANLEDELNTAVAERPGSAVEGTR